MRYLSLLCAVCCAGCAAWRSSPSPTWSAAPPVQPGATWNPSTGDAAPAAASPTPDSNFSTSRPVGPTPSTSGDKAPTPTYETHPSQAQPRSPSSTVAPYRGSPSGSSFPPPTNRAPAGAEPANFNFAPRIPDPNAAVPAPTHVAAADRGPRGSTTAPHQRIAASTAAPGLTWKPIARSNGGRSLEVLQLGRGPRHLLIMGSLIGNERDSVAFVESLAELLQREPQRLADFTLVCIRTPNPDGYTEATFTNGRGVALNRNFPSQNFFGQRTAETGLTEASERETQAIMHLCDDFRPDRVVHVRAGQAQRTLVLANAAAVPGLRERLDRGLLDGGEFEAYKAGSIEEYATEKLKCELLLLSLPSDAGSWKTEIGRVAAVLIGPPASSIRPASQSETPAATPTTTADVKADGPRQSGPPDLFAPYKAPAQLAGTVEPAAATGSRGHVELLPPPPEFAAAPKGQDARYYALPPPPE